MTSSPALPVSLSLEDSELLSFYSSQSLAHLSCLADAIDVLFSSVQGNQPPRIFVARGKSLIVTAHKLVFIGDTLSRLLTSADLRAKVSGVTVEGCGGVWGVRGCKCYIPLKVQCVKFEAWYLSWLVDGR